DDSSLAHAFAGGRRWLLGRVPAGQLDHVLQPPATDAESCEAEAQREPLAPPAPRQGGVGAGRDMTDEAGGLAIDLQAWLEWWVELRLELESWLGVAVERVADRERVAGRERPLGAA